MIRTQGDQYFLIIVARYSAFTEPDSMGTTFQNKQGQPRYKSSGVIVIIQNKLMVKHRLIQKYNKQKESHFASFITRYTGWYFYICICT